jgi:hypothetical protein
MRPGERLWDWSPTNVMRPGAQRGYGRRDDGLTDGGEVPPPPTLGPARSLTVEDAARALARGMVDGTVRTRTETRYKPSVVRKYEEQRRTLAGPRPVAAITKGDILFSGPLCESVE